MTRGLGLLLALALTGAVSASAGACNQQGDCPAPTAIKAGASCGGDQLQCAYSLTTDDAACTSCTCTEGTWVCPTDFSCGDGAAPSADGGATDDGATEASADDTGTGSDAPSEAAPTDTGTVDAPTEAASTDTGAADAPVDSGGGG